MDEATLSDKPIPLCSPQIQGNEWKYVKECLDTGWISSVGAYVDHFERLMARRMKAQYAVATTCGTAALHVALLVAGVQADDEVLVSDLTFIAPANAIRYAGAWPVLIDVEPDYWQMDPERVREFLEERCIWREGALFNRVSGRRIRAILPVHILGHPVNLNPILDLARKYDLHVIEDASESLGAQYQGSPTGNLGDISCFSFNGNKLITTGGGGMIVTDNEGWAARARHLTTQAKQHPTEYIHNEIGYNYRLTNIQAAVGVAQLELLDCYVTSKRTIAATYNNAYQSFSGIYPMREAPWARSSYWMYTLRVVEDEYRMDSRTLLQTFAALNIQARPLWQPLHLSPAHLGSQVMGGAVAEELWRTALSLPCSVGLTTSQQTRVIDLIASKRPTSKDAKSKRVLEMPARA